MAWYHFIPGVGQVVLAGELITKAVSSNEPTTAPAQSTTKDSALLLTNTTTPKTIEKEVIVEKDSNPPLDITLTLMIVFSFSVLGAVIVAIITSTRRKKSQK